MKPRQVAFGGHLYALAEDGRVLAAHQEAWEALWSSHRGVITESGARHSPGPYPSIAFYLPEFDRNPAPPATPIAPASKEREPGMP